MGYLIMFDDVQVNSFDILGVTKDHADSRQAFVKELRKTICFNIKKHADSFGKVVLGC